MSQSQISFKESMFENQPHGSMIENSQMMSYKSLRSNIVIADHELNQQDYDSNTHFMENMMSNEDLNDEIEFQKPRDRNKTTKIQKTFVLKEVNRKKKGVNPLKERFAVYQPDVSNSVSK